MKSPKILLYAVIALLSAISLQSCQQSITESLTLTKAKLENSLASKTELVVDNMILAYQQVQSLSYQGEFDNAMTDVLSNNGNLYEPSALVNDTMRRKLQVLYVYKQAIHEYALLADEGFTGQQTPFSKCCQSIQDAYSTLGDTAAVKTSGSIATYLRASHYDENQVIKILLNALKDVWVGDVDVWNTQLNASFVDYQYRISSIPDGSFNEEKLQKYVYQPYDGKHNLVEAYKLNLIKERRDSLQSFLTRQDNITSALQYITLAIDEFLKKASDKNAVVNYLNRVEIVLGVDDHSNDSSDNNN